MDINAASSSFQSMTFPINSANWSVGDVMAVGCQAQIQDITSSYISEVFNAVSYCDIGWFRNGVIGGGTIVLGLNAGPTLQVFTVSAGTTTLSWGVQTKTKSGVETQIRIGNMAVYNLTRLGLAGQIT
jgi:hypothetical protein